MSNFGQAVALAARTAATMRSLPIPTSIVLPTTSALSRIAGARENGANVVLAGSDSQDREQVAQQILRDTGATLVGLMDDPRIVLGQVTTTLELLDQVVEADSTTLDAIIPPSATGGILAGAATVCQGTETLVYGREPQEGGPELRRGLKAGVVPRPTRQNSVADGLRAAVGKGNFHLIRQKWLVEGVYAASEQQIKDAWRLMMEQMKMVVEPSSAVAVATVLYYNEEFRAKLKARKARWKMGIVLT